MVHLAQLVILAEPVADHMSVHRLGKVCFGHLGTHIVGEARPVAAVEAGAAVLLAA